MLKGRTTIISGQPALQVKDTADSDSVYVTISARPELLRIDAGREGHLDFSRYNAPVTLTLPSAAETIDGSKYGF
jgi:hypothetical protein